MPISTMKIGIYGTYSSLEDQALLLYLLDVLHDKNMDVAIYDDFYSKNRDALKFKYPELKTFSIEDNLSGLVDILFSFGGDGTFLNTIRLVRNFEIPVMGINTGRLGFLAGINREHISIAIEKLMAGEYTLDKRSLLQIQSPDFNFKEYAFALNDIAIFKKDPATTLMLDVSVNNAFLNTYFGDGILISTPTGSTAYNLSCNGPILVPEAKNLIITPIASHALTVRPIVLPDDSKIHVKIAGRSQKCNVSVDAYSHTFSKETEFFITKAERTLNTIRFHDQHFFDTIRQKLMWGISGTRLK